MRTPREWQKRQGFGNARGRTKIDLKLHGSRVSVTLTRESAPSMGVFGMIRLTTKLPMLQRVITRSPLKDGTTLLRGRINTSTEDWVNFYSDECHSTRLKPSEKRLLKQLLAQCPYA